MAACRQILGCMPMDARRLCMSLDASLAAIIWVTHCTPIVMCAGRYCMDAKNLHIRPLGKKCTYAVPPTLISDHPASPSSLTTSCSSRRESAEISSSAPLRPSIYLGKTLQKIYSSLLPRKRQVSKDKSCQLSKRKHNRPSITLP